MTYYIKTEKDNGEGRNVILVRSVIRTRQKHIGKDTKYGVNNNPKYLDFFLGSVDLDQQDTLLDQGLPPGEDLDMPNSGELDIAKDVIPGEDIKSTVKPPGDMGSADKQLDPTKDYSEVYNQFKVEEHEQDNYEFDKIADHFYQDGVLILKVRYQGELEDNIMDVLFPIIKKDVLLETTDTSIYTSLTRSGKVSIMSGQTKS